MEKELERILLAVSIRDHAIKRIKEDYKNAVLPQVIDEYFIKYINEARNYEVGSCIRMAEYNKHNSNEIFVKTYIEQTKYANDKLRSHIELAYDL